MLVHIGCVMIHTLVVQSARRMRRDIMLVIVHLSPMITMSVIILMRRLVWPLRVRLREMTNAVDPVVRVVEIMKPAN